MAEEAGGGAVGRGERRHAGHSGGAHAAFGSKGDGIVKGVRAARRFCAFLFTGLWRWLVKISLRLWTRQGEIERLLSRAPHSREQTTQFAAALRRSKALEEVRGRVLGTAGAYDVEQEAHAIVVAKRMSTAVPTFHTLLLPNLTLCLRALNGAAHVNGVVARMRAESFNEHSDEHMELLRQLWVALGAGGGDLAEFDRISEHWPTVGFQQKDPTSDLRGFGVLGLRNLVFFATEYKAEAARIVRECDLPYKGMPFAITGINMSAFVGELFAERHLDWTVFDLYHTPAGPSEADALGAFHNVYAHMLVVFADTYRTADTASIMDFPFVFTEFKDQMRAAAKRGVLLGRV